MRYRGTSTLITKGHEDGFSMIRDGVKHLLKEGEAIWQRDITESMAAYEQTNARRTFVYKRKVEDTDLEYSATVHLGEREPWGVRVTVVSNSLAERKSRAYGKLAPYDTVGAAWVLEQCREYFQQWKAKADADRVTYLKRVALIQDATAELGFELEQSMQSDLHGLRAWRKEGAISPDHQTVFASTLRYDVSLSLRGLTADQIKAAIELFNLKTYSRRQAREDDLARAAADELAREQRRADERAKLEAEVAEQILRDGEHAQRVEEAIARGVEI